MPRNQNRNFATDTEYVDVSGFDLKSIADPGPPIPGVVRMFARNHHVVNIDPNDLWHDLSMGGGGTSSSIHEAITVTDGGGLNITWSAGAIFDTKITGGDQIVTIAAQGAPQACTATSTNHLFYDHSALALALNTTGPDYTDGDIDVAHILTTHNDILAIIHRPLATEVVYKIQEVLHAAVPGVVIDGLIVSEHAGANAFDVDQSAGSFVYDGFEIITAAAIDSTVTPITRWFHDAADAWTTDADTQIDEDFWDGPADGLVIQANNAAKYYRSVFVTCGNCIHWVYPQVEYDNIGQALAAPDPTLPSALESFPKTVALVMKGDDAALPAAGSDQWIDVRPTISAGEGGGPVTDHGNLGGLADITDHAYALLIDGTRALTGDWDAGGQKITAAQLVSDTGGITSQLDSDADPPVLNLNRGRAGPAAVQLGDILGAVTCNGYDGAGYDLGTYLLAIATENWDAVSHGSKLQMYAIADGAVAPVILLNTESVAAADGALNIKNGTAVNGPELGVWSSGANVPLTIAPKGTGSIILDGPTKIPLDDKLYFNDTDVYIFSDDDGDMDQVADNDITITAGNDITLDATGNTNFNVGGALEMSLVADTLTFNNGATDTGLGWSVDGQIDFEVAGAREMYLNADRLNFNAGATDPSLYWGLNGVLGIYIGATREVYISANYLTFDNGATDTGFYFGRSGELGFVIGAAVEMYLTTNRLSFGQGAVPTGFLFTTSGRLGFHVNGVEEAYLVVDAFEMVGTGSKVSAGFFEAKGVIAAGAAGKFRFGDEVLAPNAGAPTLPLLPSGAAGVAHGWHVEFDGVTKVIYPLWTF